MSGDGGMTFPIPNDTTPASLARSGHMRRWAVPSATLGGFTTTGFGTQQRLGVAPATASVAGAMTPADFAKLAGLYQAAPSCRVAHSANQSIANNTVTALAFNSEAFDTHGFHDPATNNSRLTVPTGLGGKYAIFAGVDWDAAGAGYRVLTLRLFGATALATQRWYAPAGVAFHQQSVASMYPLGDTDYIEATVMHDTGGALNAFSASDTYLAWIRIGD